jgi:hypothetical protein
VCLRVGLDALEKEKSLASAGNTPHFLGRPARSPSLYQLNYSGSCELLYSGEATNDSVDRLLPCGSYIIHVPSGRGEVAIRLEDI